MVCITILTINFTTSPQSGVVVHSLRQFYRVDIVDQLCGGYDPTHSLRPIHSLRQFYNLTYAMAKGLWSEG